jgi:hypothetical protein
MKEYRIGEVFEDAENFDPPKWLKCVEDGGDTDFCYKCILYGKCILSGRCCHLCIPEERSDKKYVHFIETTEPISKQK